MRLAKGTRAKVVRQFTSQDRLGDVFEVAECDSESITLSRCYSDSNSYLHKYTYTMPTDEFGVFFEIIGMEEPKKDKKNAKNEALIGDYTETELDDIWCLAGSYEDLKALLKLGIKWHPSKQPKKQRKWTDWKRWGEDQWYEYSVSRPDGQSAKVKVRTPDGFIGTASCSPDDDFDLAYGVELASIRAEIKNTEDDVARAFTDYLVEKRNVEDLKERLEKVLSRAYGKAEK